jgi:hypothetical protein
LGDEALAEVVFATKPSSGACGTLSLIKLISMLTDVFHSVCGE